MNEESKKLALLPAGFVDLLEGEAELEASSIAALMTLFSGYGYIRIKPPLAEFESSLLAPGPGAALADETFRLMDPVSHKMLGIRSDITPQVARIARARFDRTPRPLRLSYANDVLRTRAGQERFARQFCQVGAEIIGHKNAAQSLIESAVLSVLGLRALGIADITLDFALPRLLDQVLKAHAIVHPDLCTALRQRRRESMTELPRFAQDILGVLLDIAGPAVPALDKLRSLALPSESLSGVNTLMEAAKGAESALRALSITDVHVRLDPLEHKGFEYHGDAAFAVFARDVRGELGRGGLYDVHFGEGDEPHEPACGFTLYMDTIRRALPMPEGIKTLAVPFETPWNALEDWRAQGWSVVRCSVENPPPACTHLWKNGKVVALEKG